jgi:hypothetical protein
MPLLLALPLIPLLVIVLIPVSLCAAHRLGTMRASAGARLGGEGERDRHHALDRDV